MTLHANLYRAALALIFPVSCAVVPSTPVDQTTLGELFEYRERSLDNGRLLKATSTKAVPEIELRSSYQNVAANINSTITLLQTSIAAGSNPNDYAQALKTHLAKIKQSSEDLDKLAQQRLGRTRGVVPVPSATAGVINGVIQIWSTYSNAIKDSRDAVSAELEKQRMPAFEKL